MLCIVWSLVRRRVTRRLTRLQTMHKVLKYRKNGEITTKFQFTGTGVQPSRNRNNINLIMRMTVARTICLWITKEVKARQSDALRSIVELC